MAKERINFKVKRRPGTDDWYGEVNVTLSPGDRIVITRTDESGRSTEEILRPRQKAAPPLEADHKLVGGPIDNNQ